MEAALAVFDLDNTRIESLNTSTARMHLPHRGGAEISYYQPLADLVNKIRAAHYAHYPHLTPQGAEMQSYARQANDSVDGAHRLQPDLVFSNSTASNGSYRWKELNIVVMGRSGRSKWYLWSRALECSSSPIVLLSPCVQSLHV